jgi:hypothetical protein
MSSRIGQELLFTREDYNPGAPAHFCQGYSPPSVEEEMIRFNQLIYSLSLLQILVQKLPH